MACFHPLKAYQAAAGGPVTFYETARSARSFFIPCGQCMGCRLEYSRQWGTRIIHESKCHDFNSFVTLTYSDSNLKSISLVYRDFAKFMRRLRASLYGSKVRFYAAGEYGERFKRPHFHAILFGVHFEDRELHKNLPSGFPIYTSKRLESLWPHGFCSVGDVTFESAAYVARYVTKKITGNNADRHYSVVDSATGEVSKLKPEFARMSLRPGIGFPWFEKYGKQVYPRDYVVVNGVKCKPPRRYDEWMRQNPDAFPELTRIEVEQSRIDKIALSEDDCTADRLSVREAVTKARLSFKKRGLT